MKTVRIKAIHLANYKGIESFATDFSSKTFITGVNGVGKSTIADAIFDIFTDKMMDGSSPDNIRPHDENGKDIDRIDVVREINIEIDGAEYLLNKTTKQKWTRPRGCDHEEFSGNETSYSINGFEKSKKEYTEFIEGNICKMDILTMVLNAQPFFNVLKKSTAQARDLLTKLSGFSIEKFVAEHIEYSEINSILKGETVENVLKKLRKDLKMQEKHLAESQSNLEYETNREVAKWEKEAELESAKGNYENACKLMEASKKLDAKAQEISKRMFDIEMETVKPIRKEIAQLEANIKSIDAEKDGMNLASKAVSQQVEKNLVRLDGLKKDIAQLDADKEKSAFCPYCGAELNEVKKKEARAEKVKELTERANEIESDTVKCRERLQAIKDKITENDAKRAEYTSKLNKLSSMPVAPQTEEYKDLAEQLEEIKATELPTDERAKYSGIVASLEAEKKHILDDGIKKQNLLAMLNAKVKQDAQACADIERDIDTVKHFSLDKNKALAESVNQYFEKFRFVFYDETQDGNIFETLKLMYHGTNMLNGLNRGACIEIESDIVHGLQAMQNLQLPIIMDNTESLDSWRLPEYENQMIVIRRTDDEVLTIKGE